MISLIYVQYRNLIDNNKYYFIVLDALNWYVHFTRNNWVIRIINLLKGYKNAAC